jgi:rhomboid family GlyGly-CTERM serine protease
MDTGIAAATCLVYLAASSSELENQVSKLSVSIPGHGSVALPWRSLVLVTAAIAAYLVFGAAPEAWVFDRQAIEQGEWWRLITAHWVHSDLIHAGWDIAALLLFGLLFEKRLQWRLPLTLLFASIGIDLWLWWGNSALQYYCGLSAVLNSLLVVGLAQLWCDTRHPLILLTAIGAAIKILVEIYLDQSLLIQTAWPSVPGTHAAGYICGLILVWGYQKDWFKRTPYNYPNLRCRRASKLAK